MVPDLVRSCHAQGFDTAPGTAKGCKGYSSQPGAGLSWSRCFAFPLSFSKRLANGEGEYMYMYILTKVTEKGKCLARTIAQLI